MHTTLFSLAVLLPLTSAHGVITSIKGANGVTMPGLTISSTNGRNLFGDTAVMRDRDITSGRVGPLGRTGNGRAINVANALSTFSASAGGNGNATLPTASADGVIELVYRQINQDGAGPVDAAVDGTSGGTQASAFKTAAVITNVPGRNGVSNVSNKDFTVQVQMPAGMQCTATVGGVQNVCIVRVRNAAGGGPFGGSAAFTLSSAGAGGNGNGNANTANGNGGNNDRGNRANSQPRDLVGEVKKVVKRAVEFAA
ncbi:hypothetical protein QBC35DRAFT_543047 [Podospora australis]|uniref:Cell surface protein n=1 Tax=Podospora australis TaxID=1536484 RepID=A0AAN7AEB7_9PEZI|nr:hypothetical protein QBC35DRAFT_543047 [Podospora australis]